MGEVSLFRLYVLRAVYLLVFVGLVFDQWPRLLNYSRFDNLWNGVATAMLCAVCLLAAFGIRYPLRMLPILCFELLWKVIWLVGIALPAYKAGQLGENLRETVFNTTFGLVVVPLAIPWGYVWRIFVTAPGDRWRNDPKASATTSSVVG